MENKVVSSLTDIQIWQSLNENERSLVINALKNLLDKEYTYLYTFTYDKKQQIPILVFLHKVTNVEFSLIIGGSFNMGLSLQEEVDARNIGNNLPFLVTSMRPVHKTTVKPFLISRFPVCENLTQKYIPLDPKLFRPDFTNNEDSVAPVYLTREEANKLLDIFGFSLPSEAQWEYACRGNTTSLFYFGNSLPDEEILENAVLLYNFDDYETCNNAANPFGLVGLAVGEWCADSYCENYNGIATTDKLRLACPPYVIRGGAAALWPWQDTYEWALCISAMRRSSNTLEDGTCAMRFVKQLDLGCFETN